jgi:hypothetical protein
LVAIAMRGDDQALGNPVGDVGTEVGSYKVQQHVEAGRRAGRGHDAAVLDVQRGRIDGNRRKTGGQLFDVAPVRGCLPAVE